ncbi:MAG: hypothetical protein RLZZ08_1159 [Pseudomonadota bacterium]
MMRPITRPLATAVLLATTLFAAPMAAAQAPAQAQASAKAKAEAAVPADLTVMPPVSSSYRPKQTSWGDPDFRGTWPINDIAELPVQRPAQYGNRQWQTDEEVAQAAARTQSLQTAYAKEEKEETIGRGHWIEYLAGSRRTGMLIDPPSGQLPGLTEEGKWRASHMRSSWVAGQTYDWLDDFDSWDRCISRGFPASMLPFRYNNGIRIFQAPGYVVVQLEMLGTRIIPLGDKGQKWPDGVQAWMGNSRGHWENGNTLVIETSNIQPGASPLNMATRGVPPNNVLPTSEQATTVERLHLVGPDTITYELTYSDPVVWQAPFTLRVDWTRDEKYEFFEYACHEGDVQPRNYISSNRALRAQQTAEMKAKLTPLPAAAAPVPPAPARKR